MAVTGLDSEVSSQNSELLPLHQFVSFTNVQDKHQYPDRNTEKCVISMPLDLWRVRFKEKNLVSNHQTIQRATECSSQCHLLVFLIQGKSKGQEDCIQRKIVVPTLMLVLMFLASEQEILLESSFPLWTNIKFLVQKREIFLKRLSTLNVPSRHLKKHIPFT